MQQILTKQEKLILSAVVVCCLGFAATLSKISFFPKNAHVSEETNVNYKMGKAVEEDASYNLDGREIDREFESEIELNKSNTRELSKVDLKKQDASKKAAADKKIADKKIADKKAAEAKAAAVAKKSIPVAPGVLNPSDKSDKTAKLYDRTNTKDLADNQNNYAANNEAANNTPPAAQEDKNKKKSFSELKAEFLANPTREEVIKIVTALSNNEITTEDFYKLNTDILASQNQKNIGLALYALRLVPSSTSFSLLAQYQTSTNDQYKAYIQEALLSYNQTALIPTLNAVVKSNNKTVVIKALEVISKGVTDIKNGNVSQLVDGRNRREASFDNFSIRGYVQLLPTLNQLHGSEQDTEIQASLQNVITLISESTANIASNGN